MRWQTTAILAVVLVALAGFYYVYEIQEGPAREQAAARKGRLWTAELADVTGAELKRGAEVVTLKRTADAWRILSPVQARGDRSRIEDALTTLTTARVDREIAAAPKQLAEFGLETPAATVTLTLKNGHTLGLALGEKSPTGAWVYARETGKPAVVALSETVLRDVTRPLADFRDKALIAYEQKNVSGFEVRTPDETLTVQRTGDRWKLTKPVALPADAETIDDFLAKLQSQRVKDFVAEAPASLAPYGLDHPVRVAIETGRDKDRSTKELLFGRVDKTRQGVYAMRPGESSVLLLPEAAWTAVPKNVAALRDKVVLAFDRDKVTRIDLESPKGKVTLTRAGTRWGITAPAPLPADQVEAGALLFTLKELRAQGFLSDDASGIPRYLARPTVRIALSEAGAKAPTTLLLAPSHETRAGAPSAYAAVAGRGPVVLIEAKKLADLTRSVTELRDRTVVPGFEPRDVGRLRLSAGGTTVTLQRKGEGEWTFVEGAAGAAKGASVENLLYTLRGLKWKAIAAPGSDEAQRYGLDAPTFTAAMLRADGGEIATVLVGRREGDVVYAKLRALPAIYAVDAKALGDLPKLPDGLKG